MIYVTGANGWLGLNLLKTIVSGKASKWGLNDDEITVFILAGTSKEQIINISSNIKIVEGNILDKNSIDFFLHDCNNDILIHTIGVIHPNRVSDFYKINRDGTQNILDVVRGKNIKRMVVISSNSPLGYNIDSNHSFNENSEYNPYMHYGKSKMEMEILCNQYYNKNYIELSIIRSPWFYGPYQSNRQKLFFEMIKKGKMPIIGSGENRRSMSYVENLVQGIILAAIKENAIGETYWISDEKSYSMNEIINTIEKLLNEEFRQDCKLGRIWLPNIIGNFAELVDFTLQSFGYYNQKIHVLSEMNKNIICDVSKAKRELGYQPEYSLIDGMRNSLSEIYEK